MPSLSSPLTVRRAGLTPLQRRVLALSATGLVSADVATALDLPVETVRSCIAAAIAELGVRSKLEAVIVAVRSGLVDLPLP